MNPEFGIYPGVPMNDYHEWDAASNSRLNVLKRSPAHLRAYLADPTRDTPALALGRAVHSAILEPDDFAERYVRAPEGNYRTKAVKDEFAAMEMEYGPGFVLKPDDYDACKAMSLSVWGRTSAQALLSGDGDVELSIMWLDKETGVTCKARADRISPKLAGGTIVDLKTTQDAGILSFERSVFQFGYHRQGAFYLEGFNALGVDVRHFTIIAVEKTPPYEVGVYRLTNDALDAGEDQLRDLLITYKHCTDSGDWRGYPDKVQDIGLPNWAWSRIDDEKAVGQ